MTPSREVAEAVEHLAALSQSQRISFQDAAALRTILAEIARLSAELVAAREVNEQAVKLIDDYFMDDDYDANGKLRQVAECLARQTLAALQQEPR